MGVGEVARSEAHCSTLLLYVYYRGNIERESDYLGNGQVGQRRDIVRPHRVLSIFGVFSTVPIKLTRV